jgi:WD40 repeat protein
VTRSSVDDPGIITEEMAKDHVSAVLTKLKKVQLRPGGPGEITFKKMVTLSKAKVTEGSLHRWSSGGALILDKNLTDLKTVFEGIRAEYRRHHRGVTEADLPRVLQPVTFTELDKIVRGARKAERRQAEKRKAQKGNELAYPGFAAYDGSMTRWFCGRADDINLMITRLDSTYQSACPTPIPLVARSGTGKSSYLAAGVAPAIRVSGLPSTSEVKDWAILTITPGSAPVANLLRVIPALRAAAEAPELDRDAVHAALAEHAAPGVVLVVDQAEEMFQSQVPAAERRRFGELLAALADVPTPGSPPAALVIVALRADFLHRLEDVPALHDARHHVEYLDHLTEAQLRAVITDPILRLTGRRAPEDLVSRILADAQVAARGSDDGQLPLIAHVLHLMNKQKRFTLACYEELGGLDGAVRKTADNVWEKIRSAGLADTATELLLRLVHVGDGPEQDTRRRVPQTDLEDGPRSDEVQQALEILSAPEARLIAITEGQDGAGEAEVTIIHESLLRLWPQLADTVKRERRGMLALQKWDDRAQDWAADVPERQQGHLLHRSVLKEALVDLDRHPTSKDVTRAFIRASVSNNRRRRRVKNAAVSGMVALFAVVLLAVLVLRYAVGVSDFTRLVAEADSLKEQDTSLAADLYLTAYRMRPTPQLYSDLIATENQPLSTILRGHGGIVRAVVARADSAVLVSAADDGEVKVWSRSAHPTLLSTVEQGPPVESLALAPDGKTLFTATEDGLLHTVSLAEPAHPRPIGAAMRVGAKGTWGLALTPDGRTLAAVGEGSTTLWNVTDPGRINQLSPALPGATKSIYGSAIAFSPDGRSLAVAGAGGTAQLWNVTDPRRPKPRVSPLHTASKTTYGVAWSHSGKTLITAGSETVMQVWNVADPDHPMLSAQPVTTPGSSILAVAVSPDDDTVAAANADNTVTLWDIVAPDHPIVLGAPLHGHFRGVGALTFTDDGGELVTGSADSMVRVWSLPPTRLAVFGGDVTSAAFTPAGSTMAVSSADGVHLWDMTTPTHPVSDGPTLPQPGMVNAVAISSDGQVMASGGRGNAVRVWDATNPHHVVQLTDVAVPGEVGGLAFSHRGRLLIVGCEDGVARLYDVTNPRVPALVASLTNTPGKLIGAVKFSPDDKLLATAGADRKIWLWDIHDPHHPRQIGPPHTGHTDQIYQLSFAPDGHTLASVGADHSIRRWDISAPQRAHEIGEPLDKRQNAVGGVSYSPDGSILATGSDDKMVRLWDAHDPANMNLIGWPIPDHTNYIYMANFSPSGDTLVTGGRDHTALVWQTDLDAASKRICETAGSEMTPRVWKKYVYSESVDDRDPGFATRMMTGFMHLLEPSYSAPCSDSDE